MSNNGQDQQQPTKNNITLEPEVIAEHSGEIATLPAFNASEIDIQIATARRYPRSIVAFKRSAMEMATLDEETAGSMFYILPRAGKKIEGPSVRLAEVCGSAWGNVRYGARVIEIGERFVTAEGVCMDLEKNNACSVQVRRRITDSRGARYGDDMIQVTANAACSIALRQAIFKIIPFAYIKDIYEKAKQVSIGKGLTIEKQRERAFESLAKFKLGKDDVLKLMKRKGIEDLTVDDLIDLRGIYTALSDGDTTAEQLLAEFEAANAQEQHDAVGKSASQVLKEKLKKAKPKVAEQETAKTAPQQQEESSKTADVPVKSVTGLCLGIQVFDDNLRPGKQKRLIMLDNQLGYTDLGGSFAEAATKAEKRGKKLFIEYEDTDEYGPVILSLTVGE